MRSVAYDFVKQPGIQQRFILQNEKAGYGWMQLFLFRYYDLSNRKTEGVLLAPSQEMNTQKVNAYFDLLVNVLMKYNLFDRLSCIFTTKNWNSTKTINRLKC